jgi:hypothetical protein
VSGEEFAPVNAEVVQENAQNCLSMRLDRSWGVDPLQGGCLQGSPA